MKQGILRAIAALSISVFLSATVQAQTAAYTLHTLVKGETLSSLAREYHTTVGDIMRLNDMHSDSKLEVGQKIKIPATSDPVVRESAASTPTTPKPQPVAATPTTTNTTQPVSTSSANKEALTHTVQSGESLYRISKKYNISVEKLMSLNHMTSGSGIQVGQVLIVSDGTPPPAPTKTETSNTSSVTPLASASQQPVKEVQQPAEQPKQVPATTAPASNNTSATPNNDPEKKQSNTPVTNSDSNSSSGTTQTSFTSNTAAPKEGFFKTQFRQGVEGRSEETKTGAAMTFKSASGWADKKFYILMNDAPPGSIVKVTNGNNAVYAKVLWSLGAQKENDGLDFRISTATAAALSITDEKFNVTVTYFQ